MEEILSRIGLWLLENVGFWQSIFFIFFIFALFFTYKLYANHRKDKREQALVQAKEDQITFLSNEIKELKVQILMKNGLTLEQAKSLIYQEER